MPTSKLYLQNLYEPTLSSATVAASGDVTFALSITPSYTKGFITFSPSNASQREIMYFDDVIGSTVYVKSENRWLGWTSAKAHTQGEIVAMKDVAEIFNFFSDNISNAFYVEKKWGLNVNVWGWTVYYNGVYQNFSDTALVLTASTTNYIQYDYPTNTISVSLADNYKTKAVVVTGLTSITSITYQVAKESYIDFVVTLNTALPPQAGNAGKFLWTDNTNSAWYDLTRASTTTAWVAEIATIPEIQSLTAIGWTGAPLVITSAQVVGYYYKWDGSDGNVTISGNTSLARDMYYNNLTVNTWITLDPAWYAIYVAWTLTLTGTAKIARNGNAWWAGWNWVIWGAVWAAWTAGTALATGTCWVSLGWAAGWAWGNATNWWNWTAWTAVAVSYATAATNSAAWWTWWNGTWWIGWTSWANATVAARWAFYNTFWSLWEIIKALSFQARWSAIPTSAYGWLPSSGSGWWGAWNNGDSWARWGWGGWSGGNGWNIMIFANILAWTWTIESKWWAGWAWWNGVWTVAFGWGGGWGGGWCWGIVVLVYNSGTPYTITVTGWALWAAGTSSWLAWTAGGVWIAGTSIVINK